MSFLKFLHDVSRVDFSLQCIQLSVSCSVQINNVGHVARALQASLESLYFVATKYIDINIIKVPQTLFWDCLAAIGAYFGS